MEYRSSCTCCLAGSGFICPEMQMVLWRFLDFALFVTWALLFLVLLFVFSAIFLVVVVIVLGLILTINQAKDRLSNNLKTGHRTDPF